ncbi:MD-2-related lipid-recognition protein [Diaphorina citri]|uniref:MD-2-related lipid-recognition protein n=1 Tax=Diaphorina citri TaxID=121845 RepID=A0A1S3D097_DIACI|nr:MD-2-related lipid-recognition protein [Diaphorina citri]
MIFQEYQFNTTKLIGQAHKAGLLQDLPLVGMDTDACKFTKCPVVAGVQQTYSYPMEIKAEYPEGAYTVKWKLWNENDPIVQSCCLKFNIVLI